MANVKFSRKEIEKRVNLSPDILDRIMMLGVPVESLNDEFLEVQILPNRPDMLSEEGFLRALESFLSIHPGLKKYKIQKPDKNYRIRINPSVKGIRPYTACAIVKNLKLNSAKIKSLIDLQEKMHFTLGRNRKKIAIGIYPLEKITLPIRYEARKPEEIRFVPLEAKEEMNAIQILHKHPVGKEYAHLLSESRSFPVFVDAKNKILSMPPIINSEETGRITEETKDVFVECSGSDFEILKKTLNIIVSSLADMGGKIYSMELIYGKKKHLTPDLNPKKKSISTENINKKLGLSLKEKEIGTLLEKMGYDYSKGKAIIPPWRTDILNEVDVIEDIAIAYGYENLIPEIPKISTIGEESGEETIKRKMAEILTGLGLIEVSSYHLIKKDEAKNFNLSKLLEVENSKTDYRLLRPNLLIPSLRIISENKDNEYPQKIFEIGTVFSKDSDSENGIKESANLEISAIPSNFTEMKQIFDYFSKMLGIEYKISETTEDRLIEGRAASITINGKPVGFMGEVHPEVLKDWNIKMPLSILEISLEEMLKILHPK